MIRTFAGWIEFGSTPCIIGDRPQDLQASDPGPFDYITHMQVAAADC